MFKKVIAFALTLLLLVASMPINSVFAMPTGGQRQIVFGESGGYIGTHFYLTSQDVGELRRMYNAYSTASEIKTFLTLMFGTINPVSFVAKATLSSNISSHISRMETVALAGNGVVVTIHSRGRTVSSVRSQAGTGSFFSDLPSDVIIRASAYPSEAGVARGYRASEGGWADVRILQVRRGWEFAGWYEEDEQIGSDMILRFEATHHRDLEARFKRIEGEDTLQPQQPQPQPPVTGFTTTPMVSAGRIPSPGGGVSTALHSDGTVWTWGSNLNSVLGDWHRGMRDHAPLQLLGLDNVTAISVSSSTALVLRNDGTVWSWGFNGSTTGNQRDLLGRGVDFRATRSTDTPGQVVGLSNITAVVNGGNAMFALRGDGTVWAWGSNWRNQLNVGSSEASIAVPMQVLGLSNIVAITPFAAVRSDGTVWQWDSNNLQPTQVEGLSNITDIVGTGNLAALRSDGTVWSRPHRDVPYAQLPNLSNITEISLGLALRNDGTVWQWGVGPRGGSLTDPLQVSSLNNIIAISSSGMESDAINEDHFLAVRSDGTVWGWGVNGAGQLGFESSSGVYYHSNPVQVGVMVGGKYLNLQ